MSLPPMSSASQNYIANLSLGNAIAMAFGVIVISASILASCVCFNRRRINRDPRIIIVGGGDNNVVDETYEVRLDQSMINSYPMFPFSKGIVKDIDPMCAICLSEYREAEMMRMLPECKHCFHQICVDAWLELNASCPICRNLPMRAPSSSPLAEVFSFSQYSSDGRHLRMIAEGSIPDPGSLKANADTMLDVGVKVPHSVLISLIKDIGAHWDIDYELNIILIVNLPVVGNLNIPVNSVGEIKLPTLSSLFGSSKTV